MENYDWKKEMDILKVMLQDECDRHRAEVEKINEQAKKVIDFAGKDAEQAWSEILEEFGEIGKKINWVKWRYVYIGVGLILFGLFLHYVIGV